VSRIFYSGTRNASSWAFRAWLALKEQGIKFDDVLVDIRRPQRWQNLAKIGEISPPAAVPVLVDDDFVIYDSFSIMEYANELGDGTLLPKDIKLRSRVRSIVAWQHSTLGNVCRCLSFESSFYPAKKKLSESEKSSADWLYSVWEKELKQHNGPYLVGDFSLADIALIPSLLRLTSHHPISHKYPNCADWAARTLSRKLVREWLDEANKLEPIYHEGYYN